MKRLILFISIILIFHSNLFSKGKRNSHYITNQAPLVAQPYTALPLGAIKPKKMLRKMLELQRDGLTGHMDSIYSLVCGDNNAWLGGAGDNWERGPYWLDGLMPLSYLLDDDELKEKAGKWVEWSINNQRENGFFGPFPPPEGSRGKRGMQRSMPDDWWPRMIMLKIFQQYYMATNDERVIKLLTNYFRYQLKALSEKKLNEWVSIPDRTTENLVVVYWLYNITGDKFLLDLAEEMHRQMTNWTNIFAGNEFRKLNPLPNYHCVNLAMVMKKPLLYYQQHPDQKYPEAVKSVLAALKDCHGFVNGMYGGDEIIHGNDPTQGIEFCTVVEMMYSFENILPITGDTYYADYLEKIAYNVLPTQHTDDFLNKQYFQQANQVLITDDAHNFGNDERSRLVYGKTSGYPCCLCNMNQGWPKFVQNLWYATADNGLAALLYGSSEVTAKVADGKEITVVEETDYPFKENIRFTIKTNDDIKFPFHLRIPQWCKNPVLSVNGTVVNVEAEGNIVVLNRQWSDNDVVELKFSMDFRYSYWYENSLGIERGPLVYALKIEEEWRKVEKLHKSTGYDYPFWEVIPKSPWNYAILKSEIADDKQLHISVKDSIPDNPWNLKDAPITVKVKAKRMHEWQIERGSAGKIPSFTWDRGFKDDVIEDVQLIPYGCTTLRISEFPVRVVKN